MKNTIEKYLSDKLIEDIEIFDIQGKSQFNDYAIIGTAKNERQLAGLVASIKKDLGSNIKQLEISQDWVVIDFDEVIVHILTAQNREIYKLERVFNNE